MATVLGIFHKFGGTTIIYRLAFRLNELHGFDMDRHTDYGGILYRLYVLWADEITMNEDMMLPSPRMCQLQ